MRTKKKIETLIIQLLAVFSPKLAKLFAYRKALNITFANIHFKQGEAELLLLPYLLNKDSLFVDIGANRGLYCFYAEPIITEKNIIAFEPIPQLATMLRKIFPKTMVVEKALSDQKGTAVLNIPVHQQNYLVDTRSTLEKDSHELSEAFETISVDITTLDEYLENFKSEKISLIKIDVEGHELKLLSGAKKSFSTKRPFLIIEIESKHHNDNLDKAFECLTEMDYSIYFLDKKSRSLKLAYNPQEKCSIPLEIIQQIHNYVCFPKEKADYAENINTLLSSNNSIPRSSQTTQSDMAKPQRL